MRILFDKNVPAGVRRFLGGHQVSTLANMQCDPQIENGKLLKAAEDAGFDVVITSDQNIPYEQNLSQRRLALLVLGSHIWPIVRNYAAAIKAETEALIPGKMASIGMPVPPKAKRLPR